MVTLITVLHVIVGIFLILVVLLQGGKGAGLGAAFGGSSQTVFGASGAGSFLAKLTAIAATLFMITSISLSYFSSKSESALAKYATKKSVPVEKKEGAVVSPDGGLNVSGGTSDAGTQNTEEEKK